MTWASFKSLCNRCQARNWCEVDGGTYFDGASLERFQDGLVARIVANQGLSQEDADDCALWLCLTDWDATVSNFCDRLQKFLINDIFQSKALDLLEVSHDLLNVFLAEFQSARNKVCIVVV